MAAPIRRERNPLVGPLFPLTSAPAPPHWPSATILSVSRTAVIVLVAIGATLAGLAIATKAGLRSGNSTTDVSARAGPQEKTLSWRETYGAPGEQLVFTVDSIAVTETGWRVRIGIENQTQVAWELAPDAVPDGSFGLALFETGAPSELEQRNRAGTLPAVRAATSYDPALEKILEPKASWEGDISARGALVAGSWVRVVFGTLIAVGKPPPKLGDTVVWITDHAYELRR